MIRKLLLVLAASAAVFVVATGLTLPPVVASHFGLNGAPNGFMPRAPYVGLMLLVVVGAPLAVAFAPARALRAPHARINLPNRDYWLAPERRARTIATLQEFMAGFAIMLLLELTYIHWLVVQVNRTGSVRLAQQMPIAAGVLIAVALVWIAVLMLRFARRP